MAIVLALLASFAWGAADFFAGLAAKKSDGFTIALWTGILIFPPTLVLAFVSPGHFVLSSFLWGLLAAIPSTLALAMFFDALAEGRMAFPSGFALKTPYWQNMLSAVANMIRISMPLITTHALQLENLSRLVRMPITLRLLIRQCRI